MAEKTDAYREWSDPFLNFVFSIFETRIKMSNASAYVGDIPVLSELASLIGSLDLETPNNYRFRDTDESITAELAQVY